MAAQPRCVFQRDAIIMALCLVGVAFGSPQGRRTLAAR